jgi:hypothetical protein
VFSINIKIFVVAQQVSLSTEPILEAYEYSDGVIIIGNTLVTLMEKQRMIDLDGLLPFRATDLLLRLVPRDFLLVMYESLNGTMRSGNKWAITFMEKIVVMGLDGLLPFRVME